jgi:hypothetical protein
MLEDLVSEHGDDAADQEDERDGQGWAANAPSVPRAPNEHVPEVAPGHVADDADDDPAHDPSPPEPPPRPRVRIGRERRRASVKTRAPSAFDAVNISARFPSHLAADRGAV